MLYSSNPVFLISLTSLRVLEKVKDRDVLNELSCMRMYGEERGKLFTKMYGCVFTETEGQKFILFYFIFLFIYFFAYLINEWP